MAKQRSLLTSFAQHAGAFDDDSLVALANKGLLRRAKKDLAGDQPTVLAEEEGRLTLKVTEETLELGEPIQKSQCTCPATGVCRHLLVALLWLRDQGTTPRAEESPTDASEEIAALDLDTLRQWGGLPLLRKAISQILQVGVSVKTAPDKPNELTIPELNQTVYWLPGAGLEGMLCSCHATEPCLHRMVAMIGFLHDCGVLTLEDQLEPTSTLRRNDAPRSREEILLATQRLLEGTLSLGYSRLSVATVSRFQTLAMAAHGVELPRLERALQALAEELRLYASRHAQADVGRMLQAYARAAALTAALHHPAPGLAGEHRTRYTEVGRLSLVGVAAQAWETRSGYRGLTLYFWNPEAQQWHTWTDARARTQDPSFDPVRRFQEEAPWTAQLSPQQLAKSLVDLSGGWRNAVGRLSGRQATKAIGRNATSSDHLPHPISDWHEVDEIVRSLSGRGLIAPSPQDHLVLLQPQSWDPAVFDSVHQRVQRQIIDATGERGLTLSLPYGVPAHERTAALSLESIVPGPGALVFGKIYLAQTHWWIEPITIWADEKPTHLTLEREPKNRRISTEYKDPSNPPHSASAIADLLERVHTHLLNLAESGLNSVRAAEELDNHIANLESLGLRSIAQALTAFSRAIENDRRSSQPDSNVTARSLLAAAYVLDLTSSQIAVLASC